MDVSSSSDDIQISSRKHRSSNDSKSRLPSGSARQPDGTRKPSSTDAADMGSVRPGRFPTNSIMKTAPSSSSNKAGPRAHRLDPRPAPQEVDMGFLTVGSAPVSGRTGSSKTAGVSAKDSALNSDKAPVSYVPRWLQSDASRHAEQGATNSSTALGAALSSLQVGEVSDLARVGSERKNGVGRNSAAARKTTHRNHIP